MTIPVGATHKLRGEFYREDFDSWHRLVEGQWVAVDQRSWDWVTRHAAPITGAMRQAVAAAAAQAENPLVIALRGCINVMERDLNGLAVIQPELKQAREALAAAEAQPEPWDGEGLPPVGTTCEWHPSSDQIIVVTILGRDGDETWFRRKGAEDSETCLRMAFFSPIRTPEQVAAEKMKQDAIALFDVLNPGCKWHKAPEDVQGRYIAAVEDGYRKQVAP